MRLATWLRFRSLTRLRGEDDLDDAASKMRVDLVAKMIQGEDEEPEPPVMLKTWDFGGQREYYVAQKDEQIMR